MGRTDVADYSPGSLSRRLLAVLSLDRITLVFDLYHALRLWFNHQRREGMYEILVRRVTARRIDATSICG